VPPSVNAGRMMNGNQRRNFFPTSRRGFYPGCARCRKSDVEADAEHECLNASRSHPRPCEWLSGFRADHFDAVRFPRSAAPVQSHRSVQCGLATEGGSNTKLVWDCRQDVRAT